MIGSEVVATLVYQRMSANSVVTEAVGDRMASIDIVPAGMSLPALLFHPSSSVYHSAITQSVNAETLGYQVKVICEGISTNPIWDAALAQLADLNGQAFTIAVNGDNYMVTFTASGEVIPSTVYESGKYYRILGTTYDVHVTKG